MENTTLEKAKAISVPTLSVKHLGFILIDTTFLALVYGISVFKGEQIVAFLPTWAVVILFMLATCRLARTLSFNEIAEPLRAPFTVVKPDSCGAGADVHPKDGDGLVYVIGSLLSCPICTGTWSALALVGAWAWNEAFGITLIAILGLAGASEVIHYGNEFLSWGGRMFRVISGSINPDK